MKICRLGGGKKVYPAIFSAFFNYDFCRTLKSGEGQLPPRHTTACYQINLEEKIHSRSHSEAQMGNGVHFVWKPAFRPKFDAENDGADRFLKNGAQNSIMAT